jgi:HAD superfamily hydrolase (TIGR01490 family)
MSMTIAFFDLDKTVLAQNSAKLWIKSQWQTGQIGLRQMVGASYWLAKYHLGFTKFDEVIVKALSLVKGEVEAEVIAATKIFFTDQIRPLYRPGALKAIEQHRSHGHKIALLTSTFDGLSGLVQNDLGLDYCLCTHLEVDSRGIYTGKTIGPPCFGRHKITFAQKLCEELNVNLADCSFYTDSATDMPLLHLVGNAVAVNPDPHLRARAQVHKWPIVDWGKPQWTKTT